QTPFTDPGATASDAADGDLSGSIVPTGAVDPNVAGTYTLTYNVTDSQSNAAPTVTRDVIVADRTAPVITLNGAATVQHEQGTTYTDLGAAATDVIDGSVTVNVANAVNQSTAGSYTVTYNAVDAAGNAATPVVRTVIVSDTTAPTITITGASPQTHEFGAVFVDEGATASDNIDGDISSRIGASGSVNPNALGTYFISYNVTDLSGNAAATATRTVEVVDTGAPVITVNGANPLYHELNTPFTDPGASATDAVDPSVTVITSGDTVDANTAGTYTILYDAQDQDLNDANQRSRTVIVGDFTAPVISLNGDSTITHEQLTPYVDLGATATDNIDGDMGNVPSTGSVASNTAGTYLLSYDISDAAGNDAVTVVRTVIVEDTTPPSLSLSGLATVNHEQGTPYVDPGATASDNLDGNLTSNIVVSNPVNSGLAGTYTVSYNVTDAAGNPASTLTRTVIVADTAAPTININGATSINHEQGTAYVDAGATASDLVDGSLTSSISTVNNVNSAAAGSYTVTYNVSDAAGNAASTATRTVVVADTTAPIILRTGPATVNVEQGTSYTDQGATATDTVDGVLTGSIATVNPVNVNVAGSYSVTYDVSDAANNAASQVTRTVIVADTTPPVITLVGAPTVNIEQGDTYNDAGATASDSVDGPLTGSISTNNPVNTNIPGTYTVTYNVSDVAGNFAAQVTRTVIVADTTPPAISLIGSSTVNVEQGTSYSDAGATASDSVDGVITANITVSGDTVDPATAGSYVIRYDVTDAAGNAAPQVTRTIIVADTTPPLITLAGSALVNHEQGTAYSDSGATANDTVDGSVSITVGGDTVNSAVAGTYTITFDAVDAAGNNATQVTRTVIVADTMAPLISLTGLANIDLERGDSYVEDGATATDSVDGAVAVNIGGDTVDGNTPGTYTVTYNAVDAAGNNATQVTRTVSVADTIPPSITLTGLANVTHEQGAVYSDAGATANDSYDGNLSGSIIATGVNFDVNTAGVYIIEYNVQDSSGNAAAPVTRTVTVEDNTAPVITRTGSATVTVERGNSYTDAGATATDNIDGDLTGSVVTTGSVNTLVAGNYTITYNVSDTSGNAGTPVQRTVTVEDTSIPTITLAGSANVNHEQGTSYTDAGATAQDLPGENISGSIVVSGSVDSNTAGIYVLTFNVSDIAGNAANSVTRSVNVADTTAPVITLNGASTINVEQGTSYTDAGASATDLVDGSVTVTVGGDTVDPATAGTYIITYDAIDAATNSAIQVTRTVIVADTTVPVITLTGDTNIDIALGDLFVDPGYSASDNIDGDLSSSVSPTGNVDINTEGTYILSYDVSDTAGNSAVTQTRTVNVVTPVTISFEAETATISGAHTVASTNTGFTGSGYIEHSGEGFVEYTFNAFELPYDLVVRYAWDSGDRPLEVILNGQSLGTLSFPATGSLTTWLDTASFALTPQSGSNTLRLETTGSSGANLDSISLTPQ
ncbi:hypothetical protein A3750_09720, partial [Oleiphilus sp. HI0079]|uniref:immunoglobulin-like domain-containing protein n=5 Tax=unclassified Oleiphilus TaxID=2631174 RepID=UPI0007C21D40